MCAKTYPQSDYCFPPIFTNDEYIRGRRAEGVGGGEREGEEELGGQVIFMDNRNVAMVEDYAELH